MSEKKKMSKKMRIILLIMIVGFGSRAVYFGYPLLFGKMLDYLSFMGAASYKLLYGFSALFILLTLCFTFLTSYDE